MPTQSVNVTQVPVTPLPANANSTACDQGPRFWLVMQVQVSNLLVTHCRRARWGALGSAASRLAARRRRRLGRLALATWGISVSPRTARMA